MTSLTLTGISPHRCLSSLRSNDTRWTRLSVKERMNCTNKRIQTNAWAQTNPHTMHLLPKEHDLCIPTDAFQHDIVIKTGETNSALGFQLYFQNVCCREWIQVCRVLGTGITAQQPLPSRDPGGAAHSGTGAGTATHKDLHLRQRWTCVPVLQVAVHGPSPWCIRTPPALRDRSALSQPGIFRCYDSREGHDQGSTTELWGIWHCSTDVAEPSRCACDRGTRSAQVYPSQLSTNAGFLTQPLRHGVPRINKALLLGLWPSFLRPWKDDGQWDWTMVWTQQDRQNDQTSCDSFDRWLRTPEGGGELWLFHVKFTARHRETRLRLFPHESVRRSMVFYASSFTSSAHLRVWRVLGSCVLLVLIGRNWSTTGKTDLLWCITTMSSFSTPPLDEWWISTTQMHSVQFCLHLHCRDKVHAVHRLRCDGFDVFIAKVVEIA